MKLTSEQLFAPPDPVPTTVAPPVGEQCPKCKKKDLIDPAGLGWCPGCGFCKSLADDGSASLLQNKKTPSIADAVDASGVTSGVPIWFLASWIFLAAGIAFSYYMDGSLPDGDNLQRATWATAQIAVGLLIILTAQFCTLFGLAPDEPAMGVKDAFVPFWLWTLAIQKMPRFKQSLWAAFLGIGLIAGSAIFIGGFEHWFSYLPKNVAQREKSKPRTGGEPMVFPTD